MIYLAPYALVVLAILGAHFGLISGAVSLALIGLVVLAATFWFLFALFRVTARADRNHTRTVLTQSFMPAALFYMILSSISSPLINDVSTDLERPPEFMEISGKHPERDYSFPPENRDVIRSFYKRLEPLKVDQSASEVFDLCIKVIESQPNWELVSSKFDMGLIEAKVETSVFRFVDDISIRIEAIGGDRTRVDMRSKSRSGKGDRGLNARRILLFFDGLKQRLETADR